MGVKAIMNKEGNFKEQEFLDKTLSLIDEEIKEKEKSCEKGIKTVRELSKYQNDNSICFWKEFKFY